MNRDQLDAMSANSVAGFDTLRVLSSQDSTLILEQPSSIQSAMLVRED